MHTETYRLAKSIVFKLIKSGFVAYFAGGWVRDYVMGHPSEDIDIATDATPAEIMDLFSNTLLVGLAFGVVIVVAEGHQFEVATFRKDLGRTNGRHPDRIEMSNPYEDALRRDFTINGMFFDPIAEVIHDFVNGQEDIRRRLIRTIGDPNERFLEDRLRMLRALRFSARFAFSIDLETQEAIRENSDQLFPSVAMERVWQELSKMAAYPRFDQALIEMQRLALLPIVFPEMAGVPVREIRERTNSFSHFPPGCPAILFLMELFAPFSLEDKSEIAKRLKVSNKDLKLIVFAHAVAEAIADERASGKVERHRLAKLMAESDWTMCLQVVAGRAIDPSSLSSHYAFLEQTLSAHIDRIKQKTPLITAALLQQQGISPGKDMGALLQEGEKIAVNQDLNEAGLALEELKRSPLWKHSGAEQI